MRVKKFFKYKIIILLFLFLNACSTIRHDGPPNFSVDVSKIPNAKPKVEPLSKYGNHVYKVKGHRYSVLSSSKNFKQVGIASWYGKLFDSHKTSSGERYNMLAMTAAHKTLPLPTYVQVTNLRNGKRVIVKVNDRGPFAPGRIIDLSYVAAKKLGMLAHGTAPVQIVAINPKKYNIINTQGETAQSFYIAKQSTHHKNIYLQIGTFKQRLLAEHLRKRLNRLVSSPVQITHRAPHHFWYRVEIGPIHDMLTANRIRKKLRIAGLSQPIIQQRIEG